jgi:hypothetical protein
VISLYLEVRKLFLTLGLCNRVGEGVFSFLSKAAATLQHLKKLPRFSLASQVLVALLCTPNTSTVEFEVHFIFKYALSSPVQESPEVKIRTCWPSWNPGILLLLEAARAVLSAPAPCMPTGGPALSRECNDLVSVFSLHSGCCGAETEGDKKTGRTGKGIQAPPSFLFLSLQSKESVMKCVR